MGRRKTACSIGLWKKRKRSRVYRDWQCSRYDINTYVGMVQLIMKGAWRNWG